MSTVSASDQPELTSVFYQLQAGVDFARDNSFAHQMVNNSYVIGDRASGSALLVDPAYAPLELCQLLEQDQLELTGIVLTHGHPDHAGGDLMGNTIAGAALLARETGVAVHVQHREAAVITGGAGVDVRAIVEHDGDDELSLGETVVRLISTPGHTPGSQCVLVEDRLCTGDTMFLEGCGRTDLPGGDAAALHESLQRLITLIPDEVTVYPGHRYSAAPSGSLGDVRRANPTLFSSSLDAFVTRIGY